MAKGILRAVERRASSRRCKTGADTPQFRTPIDGPSPRGAAEIRSGQVSSGDRLRNRGLAPTSDACAVVACVVVRCGACDDAAIAYRPISNLIAPTCSRPHYGLFSLGLPVQGVCRATVRDTRRTERSGLLFSGAPWLEHFPMDLIAGPLDHGALAPISPYPVPLPGLAWGRRSSDRARGHRRRGSRQPGLPTGDAIERAGRFDDGNLAQLACNGNPGSARSRDSRAEMRRQTYCKELAADCATKVTVSP